MARIRYSSGTGTGERLKPKMTAGKAAVAGGTLAGVRLGYNKQKGPGFTTRQVSYTVRPKRVAFGAAAGYAGYKGYESRKKKTTNLPPRRKSSE